MDSNMFNTSDTNFLDLETRMSTKINEEIDATAAKNSREYQQRAQMAQELANQKSQNFQKLGQLVKQVGQFKQDLDKFNDENSKINKARADAKAGREKKEANTQKKVDIFQGSVNANEVVDPKNTLDLETKEVKIDQESAKAFTEGVQIAFETEQEALGSGNVDDYLDSASVYDSLTVKDYSTKNAALTADLTKDYEGYRAETMDFKVDLGDGRKISLREAERIGDTNAVRAINEFHRQAWYGSAGLFDGPNKLNRRNLLQLIANNDKTDDQLYAAYAKEKLAKSKQVFEITRKTDLAKRIKVEGLNAIVNDTNGYIKEYQSMTGTKNVAAAYEMLREDIAWGVDKGYISYSDLNSMLTGKLKARAEGEDAKATKTLYDIQPQFAEAIEKMRDKVGSEKYQEKERNRVFNIQNTVEEEIEEIKKLGTISEAELRDRIIDVGNALNITSDSADYKYLEKLINFPTSEDKIDVETVKQIYHDQERDGYLENKEERLNEINSPTLRAKVAEYLKKDSPIENNKDVYNSYKGQLNNLVDTKLDRTTANGVRSEENDRIQRGSEADYKSIYLKRYSENGGDADDAAKFAYNKVKGVLEEGTKVEKGKDTKAFGEYYLTGRGSLGEYTETQNATKAANTLANVDTREAFIGQNTRWAEESDKTIKELIAYANGGQIPKFYIQAAGKLTTMNGHMLAKARLKALGYDEESGKLAENVMDTIPPDIQRKFNYKPSSESFLQGLYALPEDYDASGFFGGIFKKTDDENFGGVSTKTNEKIQIDSMPIIELLQKSAEFGYGQRGFGIYKLLPTDIIDLEKASGLDFNKDALTPENMNKLLFAKFMENTKGRQIFSGPDAATFSSYSLNVDDMFDESLSKFNQPYLMSESLVNTYFFTDEE